MRILLVEDDELQAQQIITGLDEIGCVVDWLRDGKAAQGALQSEEFELIVLDLGLPRITGLELLNHIRDTAIDTPVLILTARGSTEMLTQGLDSGADDYLTKPFKIDELNARIRALVRRSAGRSSGTIRYKNLEVDPAAHTVKMDNKSLSIPRREFSLLLKLIENIGKVVPREQLMQTLYGWGENVDSNALEVHIHNLRKKLDGHIIKTVRGVGYIIEPDESAEPSEQ